MPPQSDILNLYFVASVFVFCLCCMMYCNYIVFDLQGTVEKQPFWLMLFSLSKYLKKKKKHGSSIFILAVSEAIAEFVEAVS